MKTTMSQSNEEIKQRYRLYKNRFAVWADQIKYERTLLCSKSNITATHSEAQPTLSCVGIIKKRATIPLWALNIDTQTQFEYFEKHTQREGKRQREITRKKAKLKLEAIFVVAIWRALPSHMKIYFVGAENLPYCINATAQNNCQLRIV